MPCTISKIPWLWGVRGRQCLLSRLPTFRSQTPFCVHALSSPSQAGRRRGRRAPLSGPQGRERRGTGWERNSPAALECQASRSPAAERLMAPARSQEQPGASSLPGERKRLPAASLLPLPLCRLPETLPKTSFLCQSLAPKPTPSTKAPLISLPPKQSGQSSTDSQGQTPRRHTSFELHLRSRDL